MALYKYAVSDNSIVQNTASGSMIPVAAGQGGWQGDAYRAWAAAGNTPDAYVAPAVPAAVVSPSLFPVVTAEPDADPAGHIGYTFGGQAFVKSPAGTVTGLGDP